MKYKNYFTKQALRDYKLLNTGQKRKLKAILSEIIASSPHLGKKLLGDLGTYYSYRLNLKDRIIYSIDKKQHRILIKRVRSHYGD